VIRITGACTMLRSPQSKLLQRGFAQYLSDSGTYRDSANGEFNVGARARVFSILQTSSDSPAFRCANESLEFAFAGQLSVRHELIFFPQLDEVAEDFSTLITELPGPHAVLVDATQHECKEGLGDTGQRWGGVSGEGIREKQLAIDA